MKLIQHLHTLCITSARC